MDDVDRHHPCALASTIARCTSALGAKLARARFLINPVKWQYFLHGRWVLSADASGEIQTPDPQIRSLLGTIEIIEVRSHKGRLSRPIEPGDTNRERMPKWLQSRCAGPILAAAALHPHYHWRPGCYLSGHEQDAAQFQFSSTTGKA
jgi:hypothetical protein